MNAASKMTKARTELILSHPFWGALSLSLEIKPDPGCGTAWVNGQTLGYDPEFIDKLSLDKTIGLIAHEVQHCAMGHPWRRDDRDMRKWNEACDKAINHDLREAGFHLPDDGLFPQGDEKGKSAEWIYARMQQQPKGQGGKQPKQGQGQGAGQGQGQGQSEPNAQPQPNSLGEVRDAPKQSDAQQQSHPAPTEQDWKNHVAAAMQQAKMMGQMPAGAARSAGKALQPKVDVKSLLLRFFQERTASDYTWARPNTRYIAHGLYLPSLDSKELGEVAIMVDTSGSMDQVALNKARGIVQDVLDECNPAGVTLYFADARVANRVRLEKGDPLTWEPAGGGGTDFRPALKAIGDDQVVCAVCITDLYGTFPESEPDFPVIWLSTTENMQAPFGETVYVDE